MTGAHAAAVPPTRAIKSLMFIVSALPILFASELRNNSRFRGLSNLYGCSDRNVFASALIHRNS
jgi:hypothetical protein